VALPGIDAVQRGKSDAKVDAVARIDVTKTDEFFFTFLPSTQGRICMAWLLARQMALAWARSGKFCFWAS
jgi:hypothetical protein